MSEERGSRAAAGGREGSGPKIHASAEPGAEWRGTGLCTEAQADGVPCTELGRPCDVCGRAPEGGAAPHAAGPEAQGAQVADEPKASEGDKAKARDPALLRRAGL